MGEEVKKKTENKETDVATACTEAVLHKLTTLIQLYENENIKELQTLVNLHLATSTQLQAIMNGEIIEPALVQDWSFGFNDSEE